MKTDSQSKHDGNAELEWDPAIGAAHVGVPVERGGRASRRFESPCSGGSGRCSAAGATMTGRLS